ncbi:LacI family DNA-binding transcriptional regulator [Pseudoroseicyclus aestuarii]|nr:substrate-binding domain-containing protein [Pseudoroseicyclus aestuarii]
MNLKELSRVLGLSQTTVSRALNGYPEVSEATRRRVREAALRHDYSPNTRAKGLATGRTMTIGQVVPLSTAHQMMNPIFADFAVGFGEALARKGYELVTAIVPEEQEAQVYRSFRARGSVDGVIVHGPRVHDPRLALLDELGLPYVVHGRATEHGAPYAWVDVDNRTAFARATDHLMDLGHARIALINGPEHLDFAHRRRDGYARALAARGIAVDPAQMHAVEMTELNGHAAMQELLALPQRPTAVLAASIILALGIRRAIEEAGLVMGRDVSVAIHDDVLSFLQNAGDRPVFTATRSSIRDAGALLCGMLLERIDAPATPPPSRLLQAELILGQSTGPAPTLTPQG